MGKKGCRVNEVERMSGAKIYVTHLRGAEEGNVVKGSADKVRKALEMVQNVVGDSVMARFTLPYGVDVGAIMGENGCRINDLERRTNTVIDVGKRYGEKDCCRLITVKGLRDQVEKAMESIKKVMGAGRFVLEKL